MASVQIDMFGSTATADGDRDCWATPSDVFAIAEAIARRLKTRIRLDVCALPWSAKCEQYFTPEVDGLSQPWAEFVGQMFGGGAAWCNPPFSDIAPWLGKAIAESRGGLTTICILPAHRVEQPWWQRYVTGCRSCCGRMLDHLTGAGPHCQSYAPLGEVVPIPGRVNYVAPPGVASSGAEFPSCFAIYRGLVR